MAEQRVERRLAAVLAADAAGYSRLMGADEEGTLSRLNAHRREFLEPTVAEHNGRIVKRTGDGLLIEFGSAVDATRCAIQTQRGMAQRNTDVPAERRIEIRIGIHVGDIIIEEGDISAMASTLRRDWKASPSLAAFAYRTMPSGKCAAKLTYLSKMRATSSSRI